MGVSTGHLQTLGGPGDGEAKAKRKEVIDEMKSLKNGEMTCRSMTPFPGAWRRIQEDRADRITQRKGI